MKTHMNHKLKRDIFTKTIYQMTHVGESCFESDALQFCITKMAKNRV